MAKSKVIVDFSSNRYSDNELYVKCVSIAASLTANPNYPTMTETVVQIKTKNDHFGGLLAKMQEGNKQVTVEKNTVRVELETLMGTTASKVQEISGGDELLILNAGFDVKRKAAPVGVLEMPANVTAKAGATRGSLEINWNVVPNAYIYELQYTEAPSTDSSVWQHVSNTKHKVVIENLIRGKAYCIKVAGAGSDPRRVWSDEIISYVM
jgi:hypothetical protein